MQIVLAVLSAAWLGLLCAVSPCPLAANVAAVGIIVRNAANPRHVVWNALAYAAGRVLAYVAIAAALAAGLAAAPTLSHALQKHMSVLAGPLLIVVGAFLLDLVPLPSLPASGRYDRLRARLSAGGSAGTFALGVLLTLAFCPSSAALFFGGLLPLAVERSAPILLSAVFGVASVLPVMAAAFAISFASSRAARLLDALAAFERWSKRITAAICVVAGIYLTATVTL
ncbi:MAG: aromatic aminobenezylarsenical efflux permease ArsG family transporter [Kiritimatiellia bacterium]